MAEMQTTRVKVVTLREDQFDLAKEIARFVRDLCSEQLSVTAGRPSPIEAFALRRSKERIDELLEVYDGEARDKARDKARKSLANGGKPPATERWPGDSGSIPQSGEFPPAAQDEGAKDAVPAVAAIGADGANGPEKGGVSNAPVARWKVNAARSW